MKKLVAMMTAALVVFSMAGCGAKTEPTSKESPASEVVSVEEDVEESKAESAESAESESQAEESEAEEPRETADGDDVTFDPALVVIDNDEVSMTISGGGWNADGYYELACECVNKTADKSYAFTVIDATVNGLSCNPWYGVEVTPGDKSTEGIEFFDSTLEASGIEKITDIGLRINIREATADLPDPIYDDVFHVYPYGEESAEQYARPDQDTDTVVYDNDSFKMVVTGYESDDIWGYTAKLYIENKTDINLMFNVENASVNGIMIDPYYASEVPAHGCAFSDICWDNSDLEDNDITVVESIKFQLQVYDADDYSADDILDETVELTPAAKAA